MFLFGRTFHYVNILRNINVLANIKVYIEGTIVFKFFLIHFQTTLHLLSIMLMPLASIFGHLHILWVYFFFQQRLSSSKCQLVIAKYNICYLSMLNKEIDLTCFLHALLGHFPIKHWQGLILLQFTLLWPTYFGTIQRCVREIMHVISTSRKMYVNIF